MENSYKIARGGSEKRKERDKPQGILKLCLSSVPLGSAKGEA